MEKQNYASLKELVRPEKVSGRAPSDSDITTSIKAMQQRLKNARQRGTFQLNITGRGKATHLLTFRKGEVVRSTKRTKQPDFEISTTKDTWWNIATGSVSPVDAFLSGQLAVRGDIKMGKRLFLRLAQKGGRTNVIW